MDDRGNPIRKRKRKRCFKDMLNRQLKKEQRFDNRNGTKHFRFTDEDYEYFLRVYKMIREFNGTEEEQAVFANNALAQTNDREVECSSNSLVSKIVEVLLPLASIESFKRFMEAFSKDLRPICNNKFSSHVLQTMIIVATGITLKECGESEEEVNYKDFCEKWALSVCKYLLNNIEEYINETYANPILRTALYCLSGAPHLGKPNSQSEDSKLVKQMDALQFTGNPSEDFRKLHTEYFTRISNWPHFKDFVNYPLQSSYLQDLLKTLCMVDKQTYKVLTKKVLSECFPFGKEDNVQAMSSSTALPVLEVIIETSKPKQLNKIYEYLIAGRVEEMSSRKISTYTLQKFFKKCDQPELVTKVISEMLPVLGKIIQLGHHHLLVESGSACERLKTGQSQFFKSLVEVLNCKDSMDQLVPAVLTLTPLPHEKPPPQNLDLGSSLVQTLLQFQKPIKVVESLLSYNSDKLAELLCSRCGSFAISAYCKSQYVGDKSKQKLIQHLKGHFVDLATTKYGSRSFDDIWDVADDKSREHIVKELSSSAGKVESSQYGKFVASKVCLREFKSLGPKKCLEKMKSVENKEKMFKQIISNKRENSFSEENGKMKKVKKVK